MDVKVPVRDRHRIDRHRVVVPVNQEPRRPATPGVDEILIDLRPVLRPAASGLVAVLGAGKEADRRRNPVFPVAVDAFDCTGAFELGEVERFVGDSEPRARCRT